MLSVQKLPYEALCRGKVAVRLHIHGADRLKAALCHPLLQLLKQLRIILLKRLIGVCLRVGIPEFRIPVHQPQLNEDCSRVLLNRVDAAPVIGDIQVAVADKRHAAAAVEIVIVIDILLNISGGFVNAFPRIEINQVQSTAEVLKQMLPQVLIETFRVRHVHQQDIVVHQRLHVVSQHGEIGPFKDLAAAFHP